MQPLVLFQVLLIGLCGSLPCASSSYCYVSRSIAVATSQSEYFNCGIWGWNWAQCTRYRLAYRLQYRQYRTCCSGWEGRNCDIAICSHGCPNGGTCIRPNVCSCRPGYNPPRCEPIYACASNPCQHGTCHEYHSYFRCTCHDGWQGTTCNIVVNCGHPGFIDNGNVIGDRYLYGDTVHFTCNTDYVLVHPTDQSAAQCQGNGQWSTSKPRCLFGNTCQSNPCQHGGTCINSVEQHYCACTEGWTGEICETDVSPPHVESCPDDMDVPAEDNRETVRWEPPVFTDFRNETLHVTSNYPDCVETFPWGQYVVQYTATKPFNGLRSTCEFTVRVYPSPCPPLEPPAHGAVACNGWITRLGRVCKTFCQQGWTLPRGLEGKINQLYVCGAHGSWLPSATVPCSAQTSSDNDVDGFFPGNCASAEAKNSIKRQYITALRNSSFSKICTSWLDLCLEDNVEVTCSGD
ncbi:E-selectin-like [Branchiostoma floridae x Branchiostoma japonicum]